MGPKLAPLPANTPSILSVVAFTSTPVADLDWSRISWPTGQAVLNFGPAFTDFHRFSAPAFAAAWPPWH